MAGKYSKLNRDQIFDFFARLAEDNPNPEGELEYVKQTHESYDYVLAEPGADEDNEE